MFFRPQISETTVSTNLFNLEFDSNSYMSLSRTSMDAYDDQQQLLRWRNWDEEMGEERNFL